MNSPTAARLHVVVNAAAGSEESEPAAQVIAGVLSEAGRDFEILTVDDTGTLAATARRAVSQARQGGGIVVAAGGDGTLNTVAHATLGSGCPFGVIPQGTFNYFGREHGIPEDTAAATRALLDSDLRQVQVGLVNERIFLVNASIGLYPRALEVREEQTERHGRSRGVAAWAALLTICRGYRPMSIRMERDGDAHELRTLSLFVGNNRLQLERLGIDAAAIEDGRLMAIVFRPVSAGRLLWLGLRSALGRLDQAQEVTSFPLRRLTVTPSDPRVRRLKIATDGETMWMDTPIEFSVAPDSLLLLEPRGTGAGTKDS